MIFKQCAEIIDVYAFEVGSNVNNVKRRPT